MRGSNGISLTRAQPLARAPAASAPYMYTKGVTLISSQYFSTFDLCVYWNCRLAVMDEDALLAQLLGMGFAIEEIERCQVAMATSSRPFSLQEATEW